MKRRIWTIVGLLFLSYATSAGQIAEKMFRMGYGYDEALLAGIINFLQITVIVMIIPFFIKLVAGQRISSTAGKKICFWNSVVCFMLSIILIVTKDTGLIGGLGAVVYYYINKNVFFYQNQKSLATYVEKKELEEKICFCRICGERLIEGSIYCRKCGTKVVTEV